MNLPEPCQWEQANAYKAVANRYIEDSYVVYGAMAVSSVDGGITWKQDFIVSGINVNAYFLNSHTGWILDRSFPSIYEGKKAWKTTDGGVTWIEDSTLTKAYSIVFYSETHGWAIEYTTDSAHLYKTEDGGQNWVVSHQLDEQIPRITTYSRMFILDEYTAFLSAYPSGLNFSQQDFYKTTDGGKTWSAIDYIQLSNNTNPDYRVEDIFFLNDQIGWIIGNERRNVLKTIDGGNTWQKILETKDYYYQPFNKITFLNESEGFVIGNNGYLSSTKDGGKTWKIDNYCPSVNNRVINNIFLRDTDTWILNGHFLLRAEKGSIFSIIGLEVMYPNLYGMAFSGSLGVMVGDGYRVSEDNGVTWTRTYPKLNYQTSGFSWNEMEVYMQSKNAIWLSGINGKILKSTDGGKEFNVLNEVPSNAGAPTYKLVFQSDSIVWAYDDKESGYALRSVNGGKAWVSTRERIVAMQFISSSVGWKYLSNRQLYKTTNGGVNWQLISVLDFVPVFSTPRLTFVDESVGWISVKNGSIYQTLNGGKDWANNNSNVPYSITTMKFFTNSDGTIRGIAAGAKVLKYVGDYKVQPSSPQFLLAAPTDLLLTPLSSTSLFLNWTDNTGNKANYRIERSVDGETFSVVGTVDSTASGYIDVNLIPYTKYYYRIKAYTSKDSSEYSLVINTNTLPLPKLEAPSDLKVTVLSESGLKLTWKDNTADETGFLVERSLDAKVFSVIDTLAENIQEYLDFEIELNILYTYRVNAFRGTVTSEYSTAEGKVEVLTSREEELAQKIKIYPNPTKHDFIIEFPKTNLKINGISVINGLGKELKYISINNMENNGSWYFSLKDIPAGLYLIQIETDNLRLIRKLIKL